MTANAMQGDRERCLEAGMDDYISKPIRREHLAAMLARWISTEHPGEQAAGGWAEAGHPETVEITPLEQLRAYDQSGGSRLVEDLCRLFLSDTPRRLAPTRAGGPRGGWHFFDGGARRDPGAGGGERLRQIDAGADAAAAGGAGRGHRAL